MSRRLCWTVRYSYHNLGKYQVRSENPDLIPSSKWSLIPAPITCGLRRFPTNFSKADLRRYDWLIAWTTYANQRCNEPLWRANFTSKIHSHFPNKCLFPVKRGNIERRTNVRPACRTLVSTTWITSRN